MDKCGLIIYLDIYKAALMRHKHSMSANGIYSGTLSVWSPTGKINVTVLHIYTLW